MGRYFKTIFEKIVMSENSKNHGPPVISEKLFDLIYRNKSDYNRKEDIEEAYLNLLSRKGVIKARMWYRFQVFKALRYSLKNILYWRIIMLKNYLKITLRNIRKQKLYSVINISGLALGMSACFLILLWVKNEMSFDDFHRKGDNIYRIVHKSRDIYYASTDGAFGTALKQELPEVIDAARVFPGNRRLLTYGNKSLYYVERLVDPEFFNVFTFSFLRGNPETALAEPGSILITEKIGEELFVDEDPMGRTITFNGNNTLKVTGILRNIPKNSHLEFDFLLPAGFNLPERFFGWEWQVWQSYLLIEENENLPELVTKINECYKNHVPDSKSYWELQPLRDIHLHSEAFQYDGAIKGDIRDVYFFFYLALFIILIACINFVNLSTARSGNRAKEISMRKVSGAERKEIIIQFFGESLSLTIISMVISLTLLFLVLPYYNEITGKTNTFRDILNTDFIFTVIATALASGILSGIYPALYMSSFQPVKILKGVLNTGRQRSIFRRIMVLAQFSLTIILVFGTVMISKQLSYIRDIDIGFEKDHVIYFVIPQGIREQYVSFRERLLQDPDILDVTTGFVPVGIGSWTVPWWEGKEPDDDVYMYRSYVDFNYLDFYKMEISEGRFFSRELPTDTLNYVLNEAAVKAMGITEPVGKLFAITQRPGRIIGVVKDFHYRSLRNDIEPFIFLMSPVERHQVSLRISPNSIDQTLDQIKSVWNEFSPVFPFEYNFLDETIIRKYDSEKRAGTLFRYFTFLAILIAALGLFGMASFLSEQRTKEIGIRKVFGAKRFQLVYLLSGEFTKWVILANIIAMPLGWYAMNKWLEGFAYKTNMDIFSFIIAGSLSFLTAITAVSFQSFKAAASDPAVTLRWE
ncbi:ABC transporter permease [candidate division KSB1 bacterium]